MGSRASLAMVQQTVVGNSGPHGGSHQADSRASGLPATVAQLVRRFISPEVNAADRQLTTVQRVRLTVAPSTQHPAQHSPTIKPFVIGAARRGAG